MGIPEQIQSRKNRIVASSSTHELFFVSYLSSFLEYPTAPFQKEIFRLTEDANLRKIVVTSFRNSAKSSIVSLSYPIWAVVTKRAKFVIVIAQTQSQGKVILDNIRRQLESNRLLINDFGPFRRSDAEWTADTIYIRKYDAKIKVASCGEAIRGLRHNERRPDIIVCDDIEDSNLVRTKEGREKTQYWFSSEVMTLGDRNTKVFVIGNYLHSDCFVANLKKAIKPSSKTEIYKEYPIVKNGKPMWLAKFPDLKSIEKLRASIGNDIVWKREFLLKPVSEKDRIVEPDWITYCAEIPDRDCDEYVEEVMALDLANGEKEYNDFSAMTFGSLFSFDDKYVLYVQPQIINAKNPLPVTLENVKFAYDSIPDQYAKTLVVEDAGIQMGAGQLLMNQGVNVVPGKHKGADKRTRLSVIANYIRNKQIIFHKDIDPILIDQILYFGDTSHDDVVDSFCYMAAEALINKQRRFKADRDMFWG